MSDVVILFMLIIVCVCFPILPFIMLCSFSYLKDIDKK